MATRTRQLSIFDDIPRPAVPPRDPSVAPEAAPRLSRHALAIIERLRSGPCTNAEFVREPERYGMNITGRISDARAAGYGIACDQDRASGIATYTLEHSPC